MDPSQNINALKQYMDLYRQSHQHAPAYSAPGSSNFVATSFNEDAPALAWAQQQVGQDQMGPQGGGDFFNSQAPAYTAPQSVQDLSRASGFPLAPQDQQQQRPEVTRAGMASNFLRSLFR